jgi:hypothetical protein
VEAPVLGCVLMEPVHRWSLLPRPLRRLRRGSALQRRLDHPEDYARQLSPEPAAGSESDLPPEPVVGTAAGTVSTQPATTLRGTAANGGSPAASRPGHLPDGDMAAADGPRPVGAPLTSADAPRAGQNGQGRLDPHEVRREATD